MKQNGRILFRELIIVIFLVTLMIVPSFSAALIHDSTEKIFDNNRLVQDSEGNQRRIYCVGRIYNCTMTNQTYYFESDNLRYLELYKRTSGTWWISFIHYKGGYQFFFSGFNFHGILKPFFICGVFQIANFSIKSYQQKIDKNIHDYSVKSSFFRSYMVGKIYNVTAENESYYFQSDNLRELDIFKDYFGTWGISYTHYLDKNAYFTMSGFKFRGILKPTFICGFFYL